MTQGIAIELATYLLVDFWTLFVPIIFMWWATRMLFGK